MFEQARGALNDAFEATVEAVKDHPLAAVGIAAGAAAAVAGAAFGASKILSKDEAGSAPKKADLSKGRIDDTPLGLARVTIAA